jgi:hypothetical protein
LEEGMEATKVRDEEGRLPIHAMFNNFGNGLEETAEAPPLDLVRSLVDANPASLHQVWGEDEKSTPLLLAVGLLDPYQSAMKEIVIFLLERTFPKGDRTKPWSFEQQQHLWGVLCGSIYNTNAMESVKLVTDDFPFPFDPKFLPALAKKENPLYRAAQFNQFEVFRHLIDYGNSGPCACGDALLTLPMENTDLGPALPIHAVVTSSIIGGEIAILKTIFERAPQTLQVSTKKDFCGNEDNPLPINHLARNSSPSTEGLMAMLQFFLETGSKDVLRTANAQTGDLPIHDAIQITFIRGLINAFHINLSLLKLLAEAAPETVGLPGKDGQLPVHRLKSQPNASQAFVIMAQAFPQMLHWTSPNGMEEPRLPFLHAIQHKIFHPWNDKEMSCGFQFVVEHSPWMTFKTQCGKNLLHLLLAMNMDLGAFEVMVSCLRKKNMLVGLLKHQDNHGKTPLHSKLISTEHFQVLAIHISKLDMQKVLETKSTCGCLPLHMAVLGSSPKSHELIRAMVKVNPKTIMISAHNGLTPIQMVDCNSKHSKWLVDVLVKENQMFHVATAEVALKYSQRFKHGNQTLCYEYLKKTILQIIY